VAAAQLKLTEPEETAAVSPVGALGAAVHEVVEEGGEVVPVPVPVVDVAPVEPEELAVLPDD
jgi:hypothetical protein